MRHFIINISIFAFVSILSVIILDVFMLSFKNKWSMYSHEKNIINSYKRLQRLKDNNKIVIIAGSNGNFSINSQMISDAFQAPVVNTSSNAGIGIRMQYEMFKDFLKKGDILLFMPEYGGDKERLYGSSSTLRVLSTHLPSAFSKISFRQWLFLYKYIGVSFANSLSCVNDKAFDGPYSEKSLNKYGDVRCIRKHEGRIKKYHINGKLDADMIDYLKSIKSYAGKVGINFIFLPPTFMESNFKEEAKHIDSIAYSLKVNGVMYDALPSHYSFPDSLYYDTPYHMTLEGAKKRTRRVIEDMYRILPKQNF